LRTNYYKVNKSQFQRNSPGASIRPHAQLSSESGTQFFCVEERERERTAQNLGLGRAAE